ncbi:MAG: DUF2125 domain-containing protein [Proteobacteria bacterium]|nr:DUF2125 domain-containing protein [Pseudomonadota bacterium]
MKYSSRFFLYAPLALLLLLAAGAGVYWWIAASKIADMLDKANGHEIAPGIKVSFASKSVSGFPFRLDVVLEDLKIETRNGNGPLSWTMEHFAAHGLTYGREQVIFEAAGKEVLHWVDDEGVPRGLPFETAATRASLIEFDGRISRFDLDVVGFDSPALNAERLQLHLRHNPAPEALDLNVAADDIQLSTKLQSRFGREMNKLRIDARLLPGASFRDFLAGKTDWTGTLEDWRKNVGRFVLNGFEISVGALNAAGSGELGLDDHHRPNGVVTLHVANAGAVANAPKVHVTHPGIGTAINTLAINRSDTNRFDMIAPIEFHDGQISVGPYAAGPAPALY